jgi:hypothetical protein
VDLAVWTVVAQLEVDLAERHFDVTEYDRLAVVEPLLCLLAPLHGDRHGRICREVFPYEDILEPKAKPQPVQVRIDTSKNGTIGALIDNGYTLWAYCHRRGCNHSSKIDLQRLAQKLGRDHSAMHNELVPSLGALHVAPSRLG